MLKQTICWVALFVASVCCSIAGANELVRIDSSAEKVNVGLFLEYFEDAEQQLTIETIDTLPILEQFKKQPNKVFNAGHSKSNYWLHFTFQVDGFSNHQLTRYLEIDYTLLGELEIYQRRSDGGFKVTKTGAKNFNNPALIHYSAYLYPFEFGSNEPMEFFIKVASTSSLTVPIYLWKPEVYLQIKSDLRVFYGILYGIMFSMCLYNLFLYFAIRESCYMFYSLYVIAILSVISSYNGVFAQYFLGNFPALLVRSTSVGGMLAIFFSCQFARGFLHIKSHSPKTDHILNVYSWVMLAVIPFLCVEMIRDKIISVTFVLPLTWIAVSLWAGVLGLKNNIREARFFVAGWTMLLSSVLVFVSSLYGVLPGGIYSAHGFQFGAVLESVIFAYALADRTHNMQRERIMLQKSVLQISERSNKIKDEFLATISHEFRTPMNGVLGALQMMHTVAVPKEGLKYMDIASRSAADMMNIIDDILNFTEVRSGNLKVKKQQFSHLDLTNQIAWIYKKKFKEKGLEFNTHFTDDTEQLVTGDMEKIEQVIVQVLDNALKFTHEGKVNFEVNASLSENGHEIGINYLISDTGVGISAAREDQVYEAFRQQDSSNTRAYGGLGIGLAISRRLIELMGGSIHFSANDGGGTIFEISLVYEIGEMSEHRAKEELPNRKTETTPKLEPLTETARILVVEDNLVNQMILTSMLKKMGYQTLVAGNGREAVVLLEHEEVDAILMDCQMPVMNGYDATRAIRCSDNKNCHKPILAVTANVMENDKEKCIESGMDDYIKKPVKTEIIKEKLDYWLHADISVARGKNNPGSNAQADI